MQQLNRHYRSQFGFRKTRCSLTCGPGTPLLPAAAPSASDSAAAMGFAGKRRRGGEIARLGLRCEPVRRWRWWWVGNLWEEDDRGRKGRERRRREENDGESERVAVEEDEEEVGMSMGTDTEILYDLNPNPNPNQT